jgi:hypothetical protein
MLTFPKIALIAAVALSGCGTPPTPARNSDLHEVMSRPAAFPAYPQSNRTYLSYSKGHGFQVNFIQSGGRAWLWYPGNRAGVPELWKTEQNGRLLCWAHPSSSYNPVTQQKGGPFACENRQFALRTVVAELRGDPFDLAAGGIPYQRNKCDAPKEVTFDRAKYGC